MIWIHGGPGLQARVRYNALFQYLVNHGYAVYAINNRGSSGYGKSFAALDDRRHGEYMVFPDEGHGFRKKENRRRAYRAIREFLDQRLRGVSSAGLLIRPAPEAPVAARG